MATLAERRLADAVAIVIAAQPAAAAAVPTAAISLIPTTAVVIGVRVVIAGEKRLGIGALARVLAWIARTSGIVVRIPIHVAITGYVAGATAGIGNGGTAISGNRDVCHVGDVAAI